MLLLVRGGGGDAPARAEGACFARQDVHSWKLRQRLEHTWRALAHFLLEDRYGAFEVPRVTRDLACAAVGVACDPLPELRIRWINLDRRPDKARSMQAMLDSSLHAAGRNIASRITTRRASAQTPDCTSAFGDGAGCSLNSSSPLSNSTVTALETTYLKSQDVKKRAGLLGCWL